MKPGELLFIRKGQVVSSQKPPHPPFVSSYVMFSLQNPVRSLSRHRAVDLLGSVADENVIIPGGTSHYFILPETRLKTLVFPEYCHAGRFFHKIRSLFQEIQRERNSAEYYSSQNIGLKIQEILILMSRIATERFHPVRESRQAIPGLVQDVVFQIHDRLDGKISVAAMARSCQVTPQHLIRVFKAALGETPVEYMNRLRIERATHLLTTSSLSVKEVAAACGFQSAQYFIRIFRRVYGCTPGQFVEKT